MSYRKTSDRLLLRTADKKVLYAVATERLVKNKWVADITYCAALNAQEAILAAKTSYKNRTLRIVSAAPAIGIFGDERGDNIRV